MPFASKVTLLTVLGFAVFAGGRILGERQVQIDSPRPNLSNFQPLLHF